MSASANVKPVIGLIGGIGSGKSTVARMFALLGCAVIDADALARDALERAEVVAELAKWWGPRVLDGAGHVKRGEVARIVFNDARELERLEQLTHPIVHAGRAEQRARFNADPRVVAIVEDCPLLLEKDLAVDCNVVVFVKASEGTRRRRVMETRGWTGEDLALREKRQMPLDMKAQRADYVVENDGGEAETLAHVRQVLSQILKRPVHAAPYAARPEPLD